MSRSCFSASRLPSPLSPDLGHQPLRFPWTMRDVAASFLSGCAHVIVGPVVSLEEARLRVGPVKVLIKFQVFLVTSQRSSKNRVWVGHGAWVRFQPSRCI